MSKTVVIDCRKSAFPFIPPLVASDCGFELINELYITSNNFCYHIYTYCTIQS